MSDQTPIEIAAARVGGIPQLAAKLGITRQAVHYWKRGRIPADMIVQIETITGVPREKLRPDLYRESAA